MSQGGVAGLFKKLFQGTADNHQGVDDAHDISVGDRFFQVGGSERQWVITRLFKPNVSQVPHVEIVREGSASTSKMISLSALMDQTIWHPERRDKKSDDAEKKKKARRRADTNVSA